MTIQFKPRPVWAALCLLFSFLAVSSSALPLTVAEVSDTHIVSPLITPAVAGYDLNTRVFTSSTNLSPGSGAVLNTSDFSSLLANDIEGAFLLDAKINGSGTVQSGTFALVGKSDTLGIANGTAMITATVTDAYYDSSNGSFQFRARVDFVSPALAAQVGQVKSLLMFYSVAPGGAFDANPWNASFFESGFTTGPDVFLLDSALPLTPPEALTEYVLAPSTGPFSAYNHVTNLYTITQEASPANPFFLRSYPSFGISIANDFGAELDLEVLIDENGSVASDGSFTIKGKSSSLGIPEGSTILAGTVAEVLYVPNQQTIQFLLMINEVHPGLEARIGPIRSMLLYDYQSVGGAFDANPWNASFTDGAYTSGPDMFMTPETLMPSDTDGDGIASAQDNCTLVSNGDQRDADNDGIGSICDSDFNNDCAVNFLDLSYMKENFLGNDSVADMNGDGSVNFFDVALLTRQFLANYEVDNPSSVTNVCD